MARVKSAPRRGEAPLPAYYKLQMELLAGIENGQWAPGEAIPPERRIAEQFEVSLGTVNRALANLVHDGYLKRIQGKGTYVAGTTIPLESVRYTRLRREFGDSDPRFKIKMLGLELVPGFEPANRLLKLRKTTKLWKMGRLFENRQGPMIYYLSYLPQTLFRDLDKFAMPLLEKITLYEAIEKKYGLPTIFNQEMFSAVPAPAEAARLLGAEPGSPILKIEMLSFTYKEKPYEYRISYCVTGDRQMFREM
ncbi:MAG: GntR family transcriptional regulator [Desulfarculaceae bacterium]|nr:GntR family transcriptional regulator [Desulfarculaceae bacterium]MCF8070770.1 GntR family transcriptional regulator [Desulfarculaceae bacterium]MCF8102207.1 GntR family transcriptional regulator [Desulfarculaceae bacterium]MCF8116994.1 GntR family transcriptional regulator [Desulfarculaceae bacterium]